MANDQVGATRAATRDVGNAPACAAQDCSDVIHIAVFFDGTGNNKDDDEANKKWSNVARIWLAADMFRRSHPNAYPIYISGVGTPFSGKALFPGEEKEIDREDGKLGQGAGAGGTRRLDYGQQRINNALRMALLSKARSLDGQVASYAKTGQQQSFADVNRALGQHRLIKQINVSIFGFSRGAALARAFCNQWLWQCKEDHGQLGYEGYPIRFCFLGLFDTVASFGLPATNAPNNVMLGGFKGRDLVVDERVERCVHQVAAHELRFAFPVDLIRRDGKLAGNWLERVYPGVHSDIGGGYLPNEQEIDNNYSRIPMRDMMQEAQCTGTRLYGYRDIERINYPLFEERFECRPKTEAAYQAYCDACNPGGTVENRVRRHMEQLYSAYGTLHRQGGENVTQREHRKGTPWSRLSPDDMAKELENYNKARRDVDDANKAAPLANLHPATSVANSAYIIRKGIYAMWIAPQEWQLSAWNKTAPNDVMSFIHRYLHDSKVGFMSNAEPFSYFSSRGISESSRSVRGWFEDNVARPVDKAYESAADATKKAYNSAVDTTKKAYDSAVDATSRGIEKGVDVANQTKEAISDKARQAGQAISDTADQVQRAAGQASDKIGNSVSTATQQAVESLTSAWKFITQ